MGRRIGTLLVLLMGCHGKGALSTPSQSPLPMEKSLSFKGFLSQIKGMCSHAYHGKMTWESNVSQRALAHHTWTTSPKASGGVHATSFMLGKKIAPKTNIYIRTGVEKTVKNQANDPCAWDVSPSNLGKKQDGITPGMGLKWQFKEGFALVGEYQARVSVEKKTPHARTRPRDNKVLLQLQYKLGKKP